MDLVLKKPSSFHEFELAKTVLLENYDEEKNTRPYDDIFYRMYYVIWMIKGAR